MFPSADRGKYVMMPYMAQSKNIYFNAYHFAEHLADHGYTSMDVMCYTFHTALYDIVNLKINRLLYNKLYTNVPLSKEIVSKQISNLHTKMYLCYKKKKLKDVFVGSWNFSNPSYLELVCRVHPSENNACKDYFDTMWNLV